MKSPNESSYRSASTRSRIERACGRSYSRELALISLLFMVFRGEGTSLWSDVLAPALIRNVFDPIEVCGAKCGDVATEVDNIGEARQLDLFLTGKQT